VSAPKVKREKVCIARLHVGPSLELISPDRQLFLQSVLTELRGAELVVATDPDCAVVLERLLPSMGDWGRRVIGDAFGDNWDTLLRHRFGSHIAQTWFRLAGDTIDREVSSMSFYHENFDRYG